jgi:hypothetical protein
VASLARVAGLVAASLARAAADAALASIAVLGLFDELDEGGARRRGMLLVVVVLAAALPPVPAPPRAPGAALGAAGLA